jgi:hypothetical protein
MRWRCGSFCTLYVEGSPMRALEVGKESAGLRETNGFRVSVISGKRFSKEC